MTIATGRDASLPRSQHSTRSSRFLATIMMRTGPALSLALPRARSLPLPRALAALLTILPLEASATTLTSPDQQGPAPLSEPLVMLTEPNPPYAFQEPDGSYHGINIDQIVAIAADAGLEIRLDIMPWARALATGESEAMHCVYATARTPEREARFKWVAPLGVSRRILVRRTGSHIAPTTVEEAKKFVVGTYRDDFTEGLLERLGFPNIDTSADTDTMLRKLMAGRIDLMPMSESMFRRMNSTEKSVERVVTLSEQPLGIACNRKVPDEIIARLQTSLNHVLTDGRQQSIYQHYGITWPP